MQNIETIPFRRAKCTLVGLDELGERLEDGASIGMFSHSAADNDHRLLGRLELFSERNVAGHKVQNRLGRSANVLVTVSHVNSLTD